MNGVTLQRFQHINMLIIVNLRREAAPTDHMIE